MSEYETALADWVSGVWSDLPLSAHKWFATIILAVVGVASLQSIYTFLRTSWPETYTSLDTRADFRYRREPLRSVVFFRCLPVATVTMLVAEYLDRAGGFVAEGVAGSIFAYLTLSTGRAIVGVLKKPRHPNYFYFFLYHLGQALLVSISSYIGVVLHELWGSWVPAGSEMLLALITGAFAAIVAIGVRSVMSPTKVSDSELIEKLREDIGARAIDYAHRQCFRLDRGGDLARLVEAVLLAEVQQRPRWMRKIENLTGRFRKDGTYGVAQVRSVEPIPDNESIDKLIRNILDAEPDVWCGQPISYAELQRLLFEAHNPDREHVDRIMNFYRALYAFD